MHSIVIGSKYDWPLRLVVQNQLHPQSALDVDCLAGWRLAELQRQCGSNCVLLLESIADVPFLESHFDLVICSFVLCRIPCDQLDAAITNLNSALNSDGYLILQDFDPFDPIDIWDHSGLAKLHKRDYAAMFLAAGYHVVDSRHYNYDTGEGIADQPNAERAVCWLLRKGVR